MLKLSISLEGEKKLSRVLLGLTTKMKDFRKPLRNASNLILKDIKINFETEGGLVGGWAPLKPSTIAGRIREGFNAGPILQRTGRYKQSFDSIVSPNKAIIGSFGVDYHKYHQSKRPRTRLPRRQTLFLRDATKKEIVRGFQKYVKFGI